MIRIEIKAIVEFDERFPPKRAAREDMLERELQRVADDPLTYLQTHSCRVGITGCVLNGPIASVRIDKKGPELAGR